MKIKVNRESLAIAINKCALAISPKSLIPILDNFYLHAEENELTIRSSNTSIDMLCVVPCENDATWTACLPAKLLAHTVNSLRDDVVTMTQKKEKVEIKSISGKYNMGMANHEEYIQYMDVSPDNNVIIAGALFCKAARIASCFVNPKDARPAMSGVNLFCKKNNLYMQGSEGNAIARTVTPFISGTTWGSVIVTKPFLQTVVSCNRGEDVRLYVSENKIRAKWEGTEITATLIDAKYADCDAMIFDKKTNDSSVINRVSIAESLKRIKPYLNEVAPIVRMTWESSKSIKILADGIENNAEEIVDFEGGVISIGENKGLNHGYMGTLLGNEEDTQEMTVSTLPDHPMVFFSAIGQGVEEHYALGKVMTM